MDEKNHRDTARSPLFCFKRGFESSPREGCQRRNRHQQVAGRHQQVAGRHQQVVSGGFWIGKQFA